MSVNRSSVGLSVSSGFFGCIGSLFAKLSGGFDLDDGIVSYFMRGLYLILMVTFNTLGCMLFAKSLQRSPSSAEPTLITSASNYAFSAFIGCFFLGEVTGLLWWCGTSLILIGITVVSFPQQKEKLN